MLKKAKKIAEQLQAIKTVRLILINTRYYLYKFVSINPLLSVVYLVALTQQFNRETLAVSSGIFTYYEKLKFNKANIAALTRNIHRLEKGLIMQPQWSIFALSYIEETVELYKNSYPFLSFKTQKWAHDVIIKYFDSVDTSHPLIRKNQNIFLELEQNKLKPGKSVPYPRSKFSKSVPVSYKSMLKLAERRRSIRWFKNKKVSHSKIDQALKVASLSPSACNRQPFEYRFYDDKKLLSLVSNIPFGTKGYADNIPLIAVIIGDMSNFFSPRDRHIIYIDASMSVMSFMYALETLGLSSSAINWPDFGLLERKMSKALNLKPYERPVMLVAIGYADDQGEIPYSQKKQLDQLRSFNKLTT